ncbi:hypothetical protein AC578_821 [Pseudocercospora eumusae]|uniref:Uncharacterized protein n=1 Tax=Pseudocercospora eumusae TaxID=321146 RepID=A0A139HC09_9PEZI|nr:hypothetical protein AC578_821 [Pseudocercospora eumusae]
MPVSQSLLPWVYHKVGSINQQESAGTAFCENASIFNITQAQSDFVFFRNERTSANRTWEHELRNSPSPHAVFFSIDILLAETICMLVRLESGEVREGRAFEGVWMTWWDEYGRVGWVLTAISHMLFLGGYRVLMAKSVSR